MMWVSKVPNYDAYGLFRALRSHNPPNYSHIVGLASYILYYVKYIEVNIKLSTQKHAQKISLSDVPLIPG